MRILVQTAAVRHPKTLRLAAKLGRQPPEALGYLVTLWGWAGDFRPSGSLEGLEDREVCSAAGWKGRTSKFMDGMRDCGWIENGQLHDWHEHQGKYFERMEADRARKRRGDSAGTPSELHTALLQRPTSNVQRPTTTTTTTTTTRKTPYSPPSKTPASPGPPRLRRGMVGYPEPFLAFWTAYPRKVGKGAALKAWTKLSPPLDAILTALAWQTSSPDWTKDGGDFIPHPSTYLNQRRWEDEPTTRKRESKEPAGFKGLRDFVKERQANGDGSGTDASARLLGGGVSEIRTDEGDG